MGILSDAGFGLTDQGLVVPRAADLFELVYVYFENETGLTIRRHARDQVVPVMIDGICVFVAELFELLTSVYAARDENNATGAQLENLLEIAGVPILAASFSTAEITPAGTASLAIPQGRIVEGGGTDGRARWITTDDGEIGGDPIPVRALVPGAIEAPAGEIDKIVVGVPGWDTVTNADDAVPGEARESPQQMRSRKALSLSQAGSGGAASLRAALLGFTFEGSPVLTAAIVIENPSDDAETVLGISMPPNSLAVFVDPLPIDADVADAMALVIWRKGPISTQYIGPQTATVSDIVPPEDFGQQIGGVADDPQRGIVTDYVLAWDGITDIDIIHKSTLSLEPGFVLGDVQTALENAVSARYDEIEIGEAMYQSFFDGILQAIDGIKSAVYTFDIIGDVPDLGFLTEIVPNVNERIKLDSQVTTL